MSTFAPTMVRTSRRTERQSLFILGLLSIGFSFNSVPPCFAEAPKVNAWFPPGLQRGTSITATPQGSFSNWPVKAIVESDGGPAGLTIEPDAEKKGQFKITAAPDARAGCYWIRVYDAEGAASLKPLVVGNVPEIVEKEPNDDRDTAQEVTLPITIGGQLAKRGDVDRYRFRLEAGQTCVVSMMANSLIGSPMDGVLQIANKDGFVLAQNDDERGLDPQIVFTAPKTDEYVVRTFGFPLTPDSSIAFAGAENFIYRLSITAGPFVDHTSPTAVAVGASTELRRVGWNVPADLSPTPFVVGPGKNWLFESVSPNAIPISMASGAVAAEVPGSSPTSPQVVSIPTTICGHIAEPNESDVYRFSAKAGQTLNFRTEARSLLSALDGHLKVVDANGKTIVDADDAGQDVDPVLNFKCSADGDYLLVVSDVFRHGGARFYYEIHSTVVAPDYALTVAAESFVANVGKPLEVAVTVDRQNGFTGEIAVSVVGLPDGVTGAAVVSNSKDATAKSVKIVLNATQLVDPRAIRIVGVADGEMKRERAATFTLSGVKERSDAIWLTVRN